MRDDYSLERFAAAEVRQRKRQLRNLLVLLATIAIGLAGIVYVAKDVSRSLKPPPSVAGTAQPR
jgi:hypothetical protein